MRKIKRFIALFLAAFMMMASAGCGSKTVNKADRPTVTVYCWNSHMIYSGYAAYVQSQLPDIDVVFISGQNSMAYYEFMAQNGSLPDILTVRRMSMIDASNLRDQLLDLSETEVAAGFNNIYLENYRFDDGTINWLPACGEVDGYIVNYDLFEKYGIEVPKDRESFNAACEAFKAEGIVPYINDFSEDYTCLETLQGLSIQELMTSEGIQWRTAYESGAVHELEGNIWPEAFTRLEEQLKVWETPAEATGYTYDKMFELFSTGQAAMMRGTGNDVIAFKNDGMNVGILPYFGDTEEDSWLLTYPSFNVAASKEVQNDPEKEALCMRVLEKMFSEDAQNILAGNHNMIPYNTGVTLELDDSMKDLEPYITKNHLYLRLASTEMFSASRDVVRKMVNGEFTADQAYQEYNRMLQEEQTGTEEAVLHLEQGYPNVFDPATGNAAASAMTNTFRQYFDTDIAIAHGTSYSGLVFEADYTERQIAYMISDTSVRQYIKELTGSQLRTLLESVIEKEYGGISSINRYSLPVTSGCEIVVSENGDSYRLEKLTIDGKPVSDDAVYKVVYIGSRFQTTPMFAELYDDDGGFDSWERTDDVVLTQHWKKCLLGTEETEAVLLAEPTDYIDLVEGQE